MKIEKNGAISSGLVEQGCKLCNLNDFTQLSPLNENTSEISVLDRQCFFFSSSNKFIPGTVNICLVDQNPGFRGGKRKLNGGCDNKWDSDSGTGGRGDPYFCLIYFQCKQQMS